MRWWRPLAVLAAGLLAIAGCSGPSRPPKVPAATSRAPDGGQVLGAISREDPPSLRIARLDPRSLEPLPGRQLDLPGPRWPLSVAPDRSMAMLGNEPKGRLAVVDLAGMRPLGTIRVRSLTWTETSRWIGRSRLLLVMGELPVDRQAFPGPAVDPAGRRAYVVAAGAPVHLMGSDEVWSVQVHGDLAYVPHASGYAVVDLRANRVLRHEQRDLPAFLEPDQP